MSTDKKLVRMPEIVALEDAIKAAIPPMMHHFATITSYGKDGMWHAEIVYSDPSGEAWDTVVVKASMSTQKGALESILESIKTKYIDNDFQPNPNWPLTSMQLDAVMYILRTRECVLPADLQLKAGMDLMTAQLMMYDLVHQGFATLYHRAVDTAHGRLIKDIPASEGYIRLPIDVPYSDTPITDHADVVYLTMIKRTARVAVEPAWSEHQWASFRKLAQENDDNRFPLGSIERIFNDPIAIPAFGGVSWETKTYSEAKEHNCTVVVEGGIVWLDFGKAPFKGCAICHGTLMVLGENGCRNCANV